jgi:hypothetical protein
MIRETVDRLRQSQEENEMITRRRDELETRVAALETEYEELLGQWRKVFLKDECAPDPGDALLHCREDY